IHEVIAAALEASGHDVIGCAALDPALDAVEQPCDLLFLHRGLPERWCREVVARARRGGDPAIILLSSRQDLEAERDTLRFGAAETLYKPLDPVSLRATVERQLDRRTPSFEVPDSPRLLVVDDDELVRLSVHDMLDDAGYVVESVESAESALDRLRRQPFELVVTDIMMAGMSGLDLVRSLPSVRPAALALVMTGYASKDVAISALRDGAFDLLEKPLTPALVLRAVDRAWRLLRSELEQRRLLVDLRDTNQQLEAARRAAEAADRAKSQFLANMSHEVRTPLNGVLGCLALLERTTLDDSQRRYLGTAHSAGEDLLRLLTDVLDYAALETRPPGPAAGPVGDTADLEEALPAIEWTDVDPREWVASVVEEARPQVEAAGLTLDLDIEPDAPRRARLDAERLSRVLANLLDNARKFTRRGRIAVSLGGDTERLRIVVRDTGTGIRTEHRERIFDAFYQVDGGTTREVGGMGLGLALSRRWIEAMGGVLQLTDADGPGTEMVLEVPIAVARDPEPIPESTAARHALVADDNPANAFLLGRMLERLGYVVVSVGNGRQAVEAFEARAFDIVLLDYQMPLLDGAAAASAMRHLEARLGRARTVLAVVTGFSLVEYERRCREAGVDHFLTKPVRLATLADLAAAWQAS
ncbi:MAG: response regulator, partial [Acidobacteriota bacterium]